ncbi:uncharacterized protein LOC134324457 [Trichomycterus rosablanca]|uniref:uncharacterized protein LOC134324457 n=1 Tax=Trichomycterus rosablanca TaxID=2290929 RepID=UPI002F3511D6
MELYRGFHGKGAPDGVGGALKNLADRIVAYGTSIPDADTLFEQLAKNSSVTLYKVSEEDIKASNELVPTQLKSVRGTMKIHQLTSTKPGVISTREVSCFCEKDCQCFSPCVHTFSEREESPDNAESTIEVGQWVLVEYDAELFPGTVTQVNLIFCEKDCQCFSPCVHTFSEREESPDNAESTIEVGQWVLVEYDAELFPGTVTQIVDGQYEVDTMSCAGENRFFVPSIRFPGERVWYYRNDIRDIIPEPLPVTSSARHFCVLPEIWARHRKVTHQ